MPSRGAQRRIEQRRKNFLQRLRAQNDVEVYIPQVTIHTPVNNQNDLSPSNIVLPYLNAARTEDTTKETVLASIMLGACAAAYANQPRQQEPPQRSTQQTITTLPENNAYDIIHETFQHQLNDFKKTIDEWHEQYDFYGSYHLSRDHLEKRLHVTHDTIVYTSQSYTLSMPATAFLEEYGFKKHDYFTCYGNKVQRVLHQECIDLLEHTAQLPNSSPLYAYKKELAGCVDVARDYNQQGFSAKSLRVLDFCWSLLDYGKAIIEGVTDGIIGAVTDMVNHPIQTALCLVAGEYVLAYQLTKVLFDVAEIGIISLINSEEGSTRWHDYIAPINQLIGAIATKQLSLRGCIKGTAKFATCLKTQNMLLSNAGSFCAKVKNKALEFAKNNPLVKPAQYLATPEGFVLKMVGCGIDNKKFSGASATQGLKREIVLPKVKTYEQASNKALEIIGNIDPHTGTKHVGNVGIGEGKIVGKRWYNGKVLMRLDWDQTKGPHINIDDYRVGKGLKGIKIAIPFEGNLKTVESLLRHLQR